MDQAINKENMALYSQDFSALPDDLMNAVGAGAEYTRCTTEDGSASYVYSWPDLQVTCNVMPQEQIEGHLQGFVGYVHHIYQSALDARGQAIVNRILDTSLVVGIIIEGGEDEDERVNDLLAQLLESLEPIVFYDSALFDPYFTLLLAPDGSYDPESIIDDDDVASLDEIDPDDDMADLLAQLRPAISSEQIAARSLTKVAASYLENEDYDTALVLYQQALGMLRQAFGQDHPEVAVALSDVADLYQETGDYQSALDAVQGVLAIQQRTLGESDLGLTSTLDRLAWLYRYTGDHEHALSPLQEALAIRRQVLGDRHPDVAHSLNNLAMFYSDIGDNERALSLSQEALAIRRQALGDGHPDVATSLHNLAGVYHDLGDHASALPLYQEALAIRRRALGDDHPELAISLGGLAALHRDLGDYRSAFPFRQEELSILRAAYGEEHPDVIRSLDDLAGLHMALGEYGKARSLFEQELSIMQQMFGDDHPDVARSLNNLATVHKIEGQYQDSLALLQRALAITRQTLGDDHPRVVIGLANVASLYETLGEYDRALSFYQESLSLAGRILDETSPVVADIQGKLAGLYKQRGEFEQALELHQRALTVQQEILGDGHPDVAASLTQLANLYTAMGDHRSAESLYQRALDIQRHTLGDEHLVVAFNLDNQGALYAELGQYQRALTLCQRALAIMRRSLGDKHPDVAVGLSNLAQIYAAMGDNGQALDLYRQALDITREAVGDDHRGVAVIMDNAAKLLQSVGEYEQALSLHQRALAILRGALGDDHHDVAIALDNLASCYRGMGNYEHALPLYQQALAIEKNALGETHPEVARCLFSLAELYSATADYEQAQLRYQEALSILKGALGEGAPLFDDILLGLGKVRAAVRQEKAALALFQQASAIQTQRLGTIFSVSSERQRSEFMRTIWDTYFAYLTSLNQLDKTGHDDKAATALDLVLQRKGVEAEAQSAQRRVLLEGRYPQLAPQLRELGAIRARLADAMLIAPGQREPESHRQLLAGLARQRDEIEAALVQQIPEMNLTRRLLAASAQSVAHVLPSGAALVEFVQFRPFDFQAVQARDEPLWGPSRYLAFILRAGEPDRVHMIDLGEAALIDRAVARFRATIAGGDRHLLPADAEPGRLGWKDAGERLRAVLFDPLLPALGGCVRLFLAPDGDLTQIPFEVLVTDDDRCLIDQYRFTYLSTGRDLLRLGAPSNGQPTAPLVAADPDFDLRQDVTRREPTDEQPLGHQSRDLDRRSGQFSRLPGTRVEGERIASMLGVRPLLGARVLESRLKGRRSPRILHIATHGFFLPDQPRHPGENQPALRALSGAAGRGIGRLTRVENPLLRSGLALAGANTWLRGQALPPAAEDALLNGEDVSVLDLLDTDLVVLSACETGLGEIQVGEGVFGLRRAFVLAGAKTLVMSLWKVPDQQTQELMVDFYERILAGEPRAEALRQAQLAMKEQYPDPLYWGAFICQGDPGPLVLPGGMNGHDMAQ